MSRIARVVAVGTPHHITQRGNNRRQVFFSDQDRRIYLETLVQNCQRHRLRLWGYCLLCTHVHLLAVPEDPRSMAKVLGRTHADYARYANVRIGGCGHLWQARFYSCPVDDAARWPVLAYVERNPVRAGLAPVAADYPWSSARAHCTGHDPTGLLDLSAWSQDYTPDRWRAALALGLDEEALRERLYEATRRGLPLGCEEFVRDLEEQAGRCLQMRLPGRPGSNEDSEQLLLF